MDEIIREGNTVFKLTPGGGDCLPYHVSVLSKRAAEMVLKLSLHKKWKYPVSQVLPYSRTGNFFIVGFQPQTGLHIAVHKRERVDKDPVA